MLTAQTLAALPRAQQRPAFGSENLSLGELNLMPGDLLLIYEPEEPKPTPCTIGWIANDLVWAFLRGIPVAFSAAASPKESGIVEVLRPSLSGPVAQVLVLAEDL